MAAPLRQVLVRALTNRSVSNTTYPVASGAHSFLCHQQKRYSNTLQQETVEKHRKSKLSPDPEEPEEVVTETAPRDYKYVYPEFLPSPIHYHRDRIMEKLERRDMLHRRENIDIPEFYVGTIMAITVTDPYAPNKKNRFVGICIDRGGPGLRAHFTLRNVVDGQGVEIKYDLYNPLVQQIEVLRLEKRLDEQLYYLRDCPPEYSTVPFSFERVPHPPGAPVPVNTIKVKLGPRPWHERWERQELHGIQPLDLPERFFKRAAEVATPWEKHDIVKQFRKRINEDETQEIMNKVKAGIDQVNKIQKEKHRTR